MAVVTENIITGAICQHVCSGKHENVRVFSKEQTKVLEKYRARSQLQSAVDEALKTKRRHQRKTRTACNLSFRTIPLKVSLGSKYHCRNCSLCKLHHFDSTTNHTKEFSFPFKKTLRISSNHLSVQQSTQTPSLKGSKHRKFRLRRYRL